MGVHMRELILEANFDRSAFWQSVWGQDSFPKSPVEYTNYVKTQLRRERTNFKSVVEQYGVSGVVTVHSKQEQYSQVCEFFHRTAAHPEQAEKGVSGRVVEVLERV